MRDKIITIAGVNIHFFEIGRSSLGQVFNWSNLIVVSAISSLLAVGEVQAVDTYYDGGVESSVFMNDYDGGGSGDSCASAGCHTEGEVACPSGSSTNFLSYTGVFNCISTIKSEITSGSMPQNQSAAYTAVVKDSFLDSLATWTDNGYAKGAPTASTTSDSAVSQISRRLTGSFNPNTLGSGRTYGFLYGTSSPPVTPTSTTAPAGITPVTRTRDIPVVCGQPYFYRARVTNGLSSVATVLGNIRTFTVSCTVPIISGSTATVAMSEDNSPTPFAAPNLSVSDDDAGTLSWSVSSQPVIQSTVTSAGSASATGTGNLETITYVPALDFVGVAEFTVRATNETTDQFAERTITVNVNAEDDPPQFKDSPAGSVIVSDSLTVTEGNGSTPSQTINLFGEDADASDTVEWSIAPDGNPSRGTVGAFASATGTTNSITYTPNNNVDVNDAFTVRISDGTTPVDLLVTVVLISVPDNPTADDDGPFFFDVGVPVDVSVLIGDGDVDDGESVSIAPGSITGSAAIAINGNTQIRYTSSLTQFTDDTFQYRVVDDSVSMLTSNLATVTMRPRDSDSDGVIDYLDNCAFTPNAGQLDFDNDQIVNVNTSIDPGGDVGGDACDLDDDDDGMPDAFETANGFDSLNGADASEDADGDGISNLQEFLDDTNPNEANVAIDATGYLTPFELNLVPPLPTSIHSDATEVTAFFAKRPADLSNIAGPYRPGDNTISWRPSNDTFDDLVVDVPANVVADAPERPFFVRPLISFDVDQQVEENGAVTVTVRLNGDAPAWEATPIGSVTVSYSVSGTANSPADYSSPVPGTLTFAAGDYEEDITFNVTANDGVVDPNETIVFKLTRATNAVIGSNKTHTVTILEDNIGPRASVQFTQGLDLVSSAYTGSSITIDARPSDANGAQTLSCDWSGTDNALVPPGIVADCVATPTWPVNVPVVGNYLIDVVVTDNGSPVRSTRVSRILHVAAGAPTVLGTQNSDNEGDDDATEGFDDADGDGIPAYLDAIAASNLIPDQTEDMSKVLLLETEPGLTLRRGTTTQAANIFGALVSDRDIARFGSVSGDAPVNSDDDLEHVGGIYDFEIDGLIPGTSARIVIPLQSAIPQDARYRKFNPATGWSDFVVDANNKITSTTGELGACPEPGSSAYLRGLNYLDNCIQLTIEDGGPNDTDNQANGVINDPATVGFKITEPEGFEEVEDGSGGGRVSPLLLAMLLVLGGFAFRRRQRGLRVD